MIYGRYIVMESEDKSKLKKNFRSKETPEYTDIDILSAEGKKHYDKISESKSEYLEKYGAGRILITKDAKEMIGYLIVFKNWCLDGDSGQKFGGNFISPIFVEKKYRGMGFGRILLDIAIKKYDANLLNVHPDNEVAIRMYEKSGFKTVDTKKEYDVNIMLRGANRHKE